MNNINYLKTKMLSTLNKFIIDIDAFGHSYEWSFNERQGKYKTRVGGFLTIIINGFIIWLTYLYVMQMINYSNDTINISE